MSGPQHYRESEQLLGTARRITDDTARDTILRADLIACAQVHAMLALAAATAYQAEKDYCGGEADSRSWVQVTS